MAVITDKQLTEALRITSAALRANRLTDINARIAATNKLTARLKKLNTQIRKNK